MLLAASLRFSKPTTLTNQSGSHHFKAGTDDLNELALQFGNKIGSFLTDGNGDGVMVEQVDMQNCLAKWHKDHSDTQQFNSKWKVKLFLLLFVTCTADSTFGILLKLTIQLSHYLSRNKTNILFIFLWNLLIDSYT
jgi:hypothetical protein